MSHWPQYVVAVFMGLQFLAACRGQGRGAAATTATVAAVGVVAGVCYALHAGGFW